MGWTFCKPDRSSLIEEIKTRLTRPTAWDDGSFVDPTDISVVGNTLYALLQRPASAEYPDGLRVILVYLLKGSPAYRGDSYAWGYKDMSEDMGPCVYTCPLKFLDRSTCNTPYAVEWRQNCRDYHARKSDRRKAVAALTDGLYQFDLSGVTNAAALDWFELHGSQFRLEGNRWYTPFKGARIKAPKTWGLSFNCKLIAE